MHTTIAVSPANRDRLFALKRTWRMRNMDQVLDRLLDAPPVAEDARSLYAKHEDEVQAVLKAHGITRLVAFGSRARGGARPDSDLDLAIDVPETISAFDLVHIQDELSAAFRVPVDVVTFRSLPPALRERVSHEGVTLHG